MPHQGSKAKFGFVVTSSSLATITWQQPSAPIQLVQGGTFDVHTLVSSSANYALALTQIAGTLPFGVSFSPATGILSLTSNATLGEFDGSQFNANDGHGASANSGLINFNVNTASPSAQITNISRQARSQTPYTYAARPWQPTISGHGTGCGLSDALNAATSGDTLTVPPGTYRFAWGTNGKSITIRGTITGDRTQRWKNDWYPVYFGSPVDSFGTNVINMANHIFFNDDPVYFTQRGGTGTLPTGLVLGNNTLTAGQFYFIANATPNSFTLTQGTSPSTATPVSFTPGGTGTVYLKAVGAVSGIGWPSSLLIGAGANGPSNIVVNYSDFEVYGSALDNIGETQSGFTTWTISNAKIGWGPGANGMITGAFHVTSTLSLINFEVSDFGSSDHHNMYLEGNSTYLEGVWSHMSGVDRHGFTFQSQGHLLKLRSPIVTILACLLDGSGGGTYSRVLDMQNGANAKINGLIINHKYNKLAGNAGQSGSASPDPIRWGDGCLPTVDSVLPADPFGFGKPWIPGISEAFNAQQNTIIIQNTINAGDALRTSGGAPQQIYSSVSVTTANTFSAGTPGLCNVANHGYLEGQTVRFTCSVNATFPSNNGGIAFSSTVKGSQTVDVFVRNPTAGTFQISLTASSAPLNFTDTGNGLGVVVARTSGFNPVAFPSFWCSLATPFPDQRASGFLGNDATPLIYNHQDNVIVTPQIGGDLGGTNVIPWFNGDSWLAGTVGAGAGVRKTLADLTNPTNGDYSLSTPITGSQNWATKSYVHPAQTAPRSDANLGAQPGSVLPAYIQTLLATPGNVMDLTNNTLSSVNPAGQSYLGTINLGAQSGLFSQCTSIWNPHYGTQGALMHGDSSGHDSNYAGNEFYVMAFGNSVAGNNWLRLTNPYPDGPPNSPGVSSNNYCTGLGGTLGCNVGEGTISYTGWDGTHGEYVPLSGVGLANSPSGDHTRSHQCVAAGGTGGLGRVFYPKTGTSNSLLGAPLTGWAHTFDCGVETVPTYAWNLPWWKRANSVTQNDSRGGGTWYQTAIDRIGYLAGGQIYQQITTLKVFNLNTNDWELPDVPLININSPVITAGLGVTSDGAVEYIDDRQLLLHVMWSSAGDSRNGVALVDLSQKVGGKYQWMRMPWLPAAGFIWTGGITGDWVNAAYSTTMKYCPADGNFYLLIDNVDLGTGCQLWRFTPPFDLRTSISNLAAMQTPGNGVWKNITSSLVTPLRTGTVMARWGPYRSFWWHPTFGCFLWNADVNVKAQGVNVLGIP